MSVASVHSWSLCVHPDKSGWKAMSTHFQTADKWIKLLGAILAVAAMTAPTVGLLSRLQDMSAKARLFFPTFMLGGGLVTLFENAKEVSDKAKQNQYDKKFVQKSNGVVKEGINIARATTTWATLAEHPFACAAPGFTCASELSKLIEFGLSFEDKQKEGATKWALLLAFTVIAGDLFLSVHKLNAFSIPTGLKNGISLFTAAGGLYDWKGKTEKDVDTMHLGKVTAKNPVKQPAARKPEMEQTV